MEIREFIDSDGKAINCEVLDMNRQYETLRDALQIAEAKEQEELVNKNETEKKALAEKASTRKKLLEKLEESMSPTKQSDDKNVITNVYLPFLFAIIYSYYFIVNYFYKQKEDASLVKDLERIAQFDAARSAEEKKALRGM